MARLSRGNSLLKTTNLLKAMILSDQTIREELASGRIVIDPLDEDCIQPSSVDLHVDHYFRVFRNHNPRRSTSRRTRRT